MTRAMLATVLYRLAGQPAVSGSNSFTDTQGSATCAEVATVLMNYTQDAPPEPTPTPTPEPAPTPSPIPDSTNILIAYFTVPETSGVDAVAQASRVVENGEVVGNVEFIAWIIQEETGGDIFAIENDQSGIRPWVDQVMSGALEP